MGLVELGLEQEETGYSIQSMTLDGWANMVDTSILFSMATIPLAIL